MGIQDLQALLETEGVSVDLFRIGRNHAGGFRLVLDAEGCLDRLYGGYFSDWACGGQWARCVQFLSTLSGALSEHQVSLCVCFNGAHPAPNENTNASNATPPAHWAQQQALHRQRINSVLRHVGAKGTPPPKVWWVPPVGLHSCLRSALHQMNVAVMVSSDEHHQEVVALCREKGYAGIVGCSGEYLAFQPPRYFSSSLLKLTYRSSLETKEYMVHDMAQWLNIPQDRLSIVAALLGNTILTEQHLTEFYKRLNNQKKTSSEDVVRSVCDYVRDLSSSDLDSICEDLFQYPNDNRCARFKQSVQYYVNGTKDGFLKYKTGRRPKVKKTPNASGISQKEADMDTSRLASDFVDQDAKLESKVIAADNEKSELEKKVNKGSVNAASSTKSSNTAGKKEKEASKGVCPSVAAEVLRTCAERHSKGLMAPALLPILTHRQVTLPVLLEDEAHREVPSIHHLYRPIRQNVYAILFNMHHYHFMANHSKEGEKIPCNVNVNVSEWIYTRQNPGKSPEIVPGVMLDWPVPTVQRLWFGTAQDDKCRRMRAFLSCMRSDRSDNSLMLNPSYVPQQLFILATVLRYIMTSPVQCLRRQELDAFLATAFAADLRNPLHLQEMTLSGVTVRGIQLGAMLMAGVETALLANDACGAPVPLLAASPWNFFDGKLFQHKLARAYAVKNLIQLCDNQVDVVIKVERMRKAILEDLDVEFAMPPLPMNANLLGMGYPPPGVLGWSNGSRRMGTGSNGAHRGEGGRLQIAGVVVGQWGANYARSSNSNRYGASQVGYISFNPPPRGSYGYTSSRGRGGVRGRNSLLARGGGGVARRQRHRPAKVTPARRTTTASTTSNAIGNVASTAPARAPTVSVNGKTVRTDDLKYSLNGPEDSSAGDIFADSTTEVSSGQDQTSDNPESSDSVSGQQTKTQAKVGKPLKKNALKGKKRGTQKTESPAKTDDAKLADITAPFVENGSSTGISKNKAFSAKSAVTIMNGNAGTDASSNGDHKGQGDSTLND